MASTNISGGNFTSSLTGLAATTVYYYKAFATNNGGTTWGAQQTFTTAPVPISLTASALSPFGNACINTTAGPNTFTINGSFLTNANINVGPLAGFSFATAAAGPYAASLSLAQPGGTYSQVIHVRFTPTAVQSYNGNIPVAGGGFGSTVNVAASGSGVNTLATVITGGASNFTNHSAVLAGSVASDGCSPVTAYGIEYSGINGFVNGAGTKVASSNIAGGNLTSSLNGLVQGATYYYKAYAVNNGGTSYGLQQSFTVPSIAEGFHLYPSPVNRGTSIRVTRNNLKPGYYGLLFYNSAGQLVYQHHIHIQADFINQELVVPYTISPGTYRVMLANSDSKFGVVTISVF